MIARTAPRIDPRDATVLLREVAEVLLECSAHLTCVPSVEVDGMQVVLTVAVPQQDLESVSLYHALEFIQRAGRVRAFGALYGVETQSLIDAAAKKEGELK